MAILKSGSTVGGNLILHQGMLPLYPKGDSVHYKNYKIYTELDKPTPTELNVYDKPQIDRMFSLIGNGTEEPQWIKLGVYKGWQLGQTLSIIITGGSGYNGLAGQPSRTFITLRTGNASVNVNETGRISMSITNMACPGLNIVRDGRIIEVANSVYEVYVQLSPYTINSIIEVSASGISVLNSVWEFKNEIQSTAPVGVQEVRVSEIYTTERRPSPSEIGLGNVTNDAQVKKAGDTMTGPLMLNYNNNGTDAQLVLQGNTLTPFRIATPSFDKSAIEFRLKSYGRYLGPADDQRLTYGTNIDPNLNPMVYTTERKPTSDDVQSFYRDPGYLDQRNLNDIVYPGVYSQHSDAIATTARNYPTNRAGTLVVYRNGANEWGIIQEYKLYNQNITYSRVKGNASGWSGWTKTYSEENKPTNADVGLSNVTNDAQIKRNGDTVPGNIGFSGGISTNTIPSGNTYHWTAFKTDPTSSKTYLRGFRSGALETMWHETVEGPTYRIATGSTDTETVFQLSNMDKSANFYGKVITHNAEFVADGVDRFQFRAISGNYGFGIRNDGTNTYFLFTKSGEPWGPWEDKPSDPHPLWINNTSREVFVGNKLSVMSKGVDIKEGGLTMYNVKVNNGGVVHIIGAVNGGSGALISGEVAGGGWGEWRDRPSGIQVNLGDSYNNAFNIWKATQWGRSHIAAVDVHAPGDGPDWIVRHLVGDSSFNMMGSGDMRIPRNLYANDVHIDSDERLKSNFEYIENALDKVDHLSGLIYDKKQKIGDDIREAGIIAQRLRDVLPEAVGEHDGYLNISPSGVNALLVEAIKELRREVKQQRVMIEKLSEK